MAGYDAQKNDKRDVKAVLLKNPSGFGVVILFSSSIIKTPLNKNIWKTRKPDLSSALTNRA